MYIYIYTHVFFLFRCACVTGIKTLSWQAPFSTSWDAAQGDCSRASRARLQVCKISAGRGRLLSSKEKSLSSRGNSFGACIARNCLDNAAWLCECTPTEREGVHIIQKPIDPGPWRTV